MALEAPASRAMAATLVSARWLPSGMTLRSIATMGGQVIGPPVAAFSTAAPRHWRTRRRRPRVPAPRGKRAGDAPPPGGRDRRPTGFGIVPAANFAGALEGLRFVERTQILLGTILLDLVAVLFGGAVALLPVFARSLLRVAPAGLPGAAAVEVPA